MIKCTRPLKSTIKYYKKLVTDFGMTWTLDMEHKVIELYPNEIAIENYVLSQILNYLDKKDSLRRGNI